MAINPNLDPKQDIDDIKDELSSLTAIFRDAASDIMTKLKNINTSIKARTDETLKSVRKHINEIQDAYLRTNGIIGKAIKGELSRKKITQEIKKLEEGLSKALEGQISAIQKEIELTTNSKRKKELSNLNELLKEQKDTIEDIIKLQKEELKQFDVFAKKLQPLFGIFKGLKKIPIIGDVLNLDKAMEAMTDKAKEGGGVFKIWGAGIKGFLEGINWAALALGFIVDKASKFIAQSTEIGKSLGSNTDDYRYNIGKIARDSTNINITTTNLVDAFKQISETTGYTSEYSEDILNTQVKLTKQVGLAGDEAAQFYRLSILTGKSSEAIYNSYVKGIVAISNQYKVGLPLKATLAEVAKVSGQLTANLGYNPELIAKSVAQIKALGQSLDEAKSTSSYLLDFESSIGSELKAELLIGKQLNLERARELALRGDIAGVAQEIANQGIDAFKFAQMNVIAQKALAESFGLQADQLAEQLRRREEALQAGKSLAQLNEEDAKKALERQNIQEKFNNAILKLQDIVGTLVEGPFGQLLDLLTDILSLVTYITKPFSWLNSLIDTITGTFTGLAGVLKTIALLVGAIAVFLNPVAALGGLLAIGLIGAGIENLTKGDDVVSPGYGNRTLLGPEGAIALNNKDTVVAGTNLFDKGSSSGVDLSPMIKAINDVKASVDRLYQKDTTINLDGRKVGTLLTQGSYKTA